MSGPDLTAAVEAVLASQWGEDYLGKHAAHANHSYHASCAVCSGDVAAILTVAAPILTAEVAGLQRVIDDQEARLLAQADVIGLMRPVVAYVSRGRSFVDAAYPDAAARRALGALDDAFASSPQVRKWLSNVKEPVGPGKVDDPAELQRRIDELRSGPACTAEVHGLACDGIHLPSAPEPCGSTECPACAHWRGLYERGDDMAPTCEMCGDTGTVPLIHVEAVPC